MAIDVKQQLRRTAIVFLLRTALKIEQVGGAITFVGQSIECAGRSLWRKLPAP